MLIQNINETQRKMTGKEKRHQKKKKKNRNKSNRKQFKKWQIPISNYLKKVNGFNSIKRYRVAE